VAAMYVSTHSFGYNIVFAYAKKLIECVFTTEDVCIEEYYYGSS
jgi:hypothetical protein